MVAGVLDHHIDKQGSMAELLARQIEAFDLDIQQIEAQRRTHEEALLRAQGGKAALEKLRDHLEKEGLLNDLPAGYAPKS